MSEPGQVGRYTNAPRCPRRKSGGVAAWKIGLTQRKVLLETQAVDQLATLVASFELQLLLDRNGARKRFDVFILGVIGFIPFFFRNFAIVNIVEISTTKNDYIVIFIVKICKKY